MQIAGLQRFPLIFIEPHAATVTASVDCKTCLVSDFVLDQDVLAFGAKLGAVRFFSDEGDIFVWRFFRQIDAVATEPLIVLHCSNKYAVAFATFIGLQVRIEFSQGKFVFFAYWAVGNHVLPHEIVWSVTIGLYLTMSTFRRHDKLSFPNVCTQFCWIQVNFYVENSWRARIRCTGNLRGSL